MSGPVDMFVHKPQYFKCRLVCDCGLCDYGLFALLIRINVYLCEVFVEILQIAELVIA